MQDRLAAAFPFSHIYVEQEALNWPDSRLLLSRFPRAEVITIRHYKDVFNRPRQMWRSQKASQKLILAVRRSEFLYPGSPNTSDCGFEHFFYTTPVLNCLYDCIYCYLQGLFQSANKVVFVNTEDFFTQVDRALALNSPIYLCISYDTDLLAFEGVLPLSRRWIEFARQRNLLTIEIRTKSANFSALKDLAPTDNVILAWTLSPKEICQRYESSAPPLETRIQAINKAVERGWKVRICVDPILLVPGWRDIYSRFVSQDLARISSAALGDINLGFFRMNGDYLKRLKKMRPREDILADDFVEHQHTASYSSSRCAEAKAEVQRLLEPHLPSGAKIRWTVVGDELSSTGGMVRTIPS